MAEHSGKRYCELLRWQNKKEGVDYLVRTYRFLSDTICIDFINDVARVAENVNMSSNKKSAFVGSAITDQKQTTFKRQNEQPFSSQSEHISQQQLSTILSNGKHASAYSPDIQASEVASKRLSITQVVGAPQVNPLVNSATDRRAQLSQKRHSLHFKETSEISKLSQLSQNTSHIVPPPCKGSG